MDYDVLLNNLQFLNKVASFLNDDPKLLSDTFNKTIEEGMDKDLYLKLLLANFLTIDANDVMYEYLNNSLKKLNIDDYLNNPYIKNIHPSKIANQNWEIKYETYDPYEVFIYDEAESDIHQYLKLGYFDKPFKYLTVNENDNIWMLISPNEINTMKNPIKNAHGKVLTIGLGLGYFSYMASLKEDVSEIVIVERDEKVIKLFNDEIFPYFKNCDKIKIINDDCYHYLDNLEDNFDYCFIDIWHDVSDGIRHYEKLLKYENKYPNLKIDYWIEKSILNYLLNEEYIASFNKNEPIKNKDLETFKRELKSKLAL